LGRVRQQLDATRDQIQKWNKEILKDLDPANGYRVTLKKLERQQGGGIVNQQVQLQRTVSDQAIKTGVSTRQNTNEFYEEQSVKISFETQESQLVNFLFNVGNDPAMIRVHELNLKTADANRYRLKGDAILTANYARATARPVPKAAAPAQNPPAGAPKPASGPKPDSLPKPSVHPRPAPAAKTAGKIL